MKIRLLAGLVLLLALTVLGACRCEQETPLAPQAQTPPSAVATQEDSDAHPVALEREETRYVITIIPPSMKKAPKRLSSLLKRLNIYHEGEIRADADNGIAVPRDAYLGFVERLQKHGRLRVDRELFKTTSPSDAPVPFIIRFSEIEPDSKQN